MPLLAVALRLLDRAVGYGAAAVQEVFVLGLSTLLALYVAAHPGDFYPRFYFFFLPQTHVGNLVMVIWGWALAFAWLRRVVEGRDAGRLLTASFVLVCFAGAMSNVLFVVHMAVPLGVMLVLFAGLRAFRFGQVWRVAVYAGTAALAGVAANRVLFDVMGLSAQSEISWSTARECWDLFARGFWDRLRNGERLHLLAVAWAALSAGYVGWFGARVLRRRARNQRQVLTAGFFLVTLVSMVLSVGVIIVGGSDTLRVFQNYVASMRYLHQVFLFPLFGFVVVGASLVARWQRVGTVAGWSVAVVVLVWASVKLAQCPAPVSPIQTYRPPLVRALDEIARAEGLRAGYAGYWEARPITLLSTTGLRAYAVDPALKPFLWVSNSAWYESVRGKVDFVVVEEPQSAIRRAMVVERMGEPRAERMLAGARVLIYAGGPK